MGFETEALIIGTCDATSIAAAVNVGWGSDERYSTMYSLVAHDGQVYGPVDVPTLISWCHQGRVVASTQLVETYTGRPLLAQDLPELRALFSSSVPPALNPYAPPGASGQSGHYPPQQMGIPPGASFPSGVDPYAGYGSVPKSKTTALLWCFFLGGLGAHRFYLGLTTTGLAMLILGLFSCVHWIPFVAVLIWSGIDLIMIASGLMKDSLGVPPR